MIVVYQKIGSNKQINRRMDEERDGRIGLNTPNGLNGALTGLNGLNGLNRWNGLNGLNGLNRLNWIRWDEKGWTGLDWI